MGIPICVLGEERCGTSHCAMLLRTRFNIDMGDEREIAYNSPKRFHRLTHKGNWERTTTAVVLQAVTNGEVPKERMSVVIRELDRIYGDAMWGFKHPGFSLYIPHLATSFSYMHFIACYRDPREIAISHLRMHKPEVANDERIIKVWADKAAQQMEVCDTNLRRYAKGREFVIYLKDYAELGEEVIVRNLGRFLNRSASHYELAAPYSYLACEL